MSRHFLGGLKPVWPRNFCRLIGRYGGGGGGQGLIGRDERRPSARRSLASTAELPTPDIGTARSLYKHLVRESRKLPDDAQNFYYKAIRHGYQQHADETDSERVRQIIHRSVEDAKWIVNKYAAAAAAAGTRKR